MTSRVIFLCCACFSFWLLGCVSIKFAQEHNIPSSHPPVSIQDLIIVAILASWMAYSSLRER